MMSNVVFFISRSRKRGDRTETSLIMSPVSSSLHSINSVAEEATEEAGGKVYIHVRLKKETVSVRIRNVGKEYSLKLIPFSSQIAVYIHSCFQFSDVQSGCKENGLAPAEIRSEEENEAGNRLNKRIQEKMKSMDGNSQILLGGTDALRVDGKWFWDSELTEAGHPFYEYGIGVGTGAGTGSFHKFDLKERPKSTVDCLQLSKTNEGWEPVTCTSRNLICEAKLVSGIRIILNTLHSVGPSTRDP